MRIEQKTDGTYQRVLAPTEIALMRALTIETKSREAQTKALSAQIKQLEADLKNLREQVALKAEVTGA